MGDTADLMGANRTGMAGREFAENLTWMIRQQGLNNSILASMIGVTRAAVSRWCRGQGHPSEENFQAICAALQCTQRDLLHARKPARVALIPIAEWAKRERIPLARAYDLFTLRILDASRASPTGLATMVPESLRAPQDSKRLVRAAKRPGWVPVFQENFRLLMLNRRYEEIARKAGVTEAAVSHWVTERNYPAEERLPLIAEALNITVEALVGSYSTPLRTATVQEEV